MPLMTSRQWNAWTPPPEPPYIIGGGVLNRNCKLLLFGAEKTYKSMIVMDIAYHVATGQPWFGFTTTKSKVAILQLEVPDISMHSRILEYEYNRFKKLGIEPPLDSVAITDRDKNVRLDHEWGFDYVAKMIVPFAPDVLVLDCAYMLMEGSLSDDREVKKVLNNIDRIADKYKLTVILVHHSRKTVVAGGAPIDLGVEEATGSRNFLYWADSMIRVDKLKDDNKSQTTDIRLSFGGSREAKYLIKPVKFKIHRNDLRFERIVEPVEISLYPAATGGEDVDYNEEDFAVG